MKANFTENFLSRNEISPRSSNNLYLLQRISKKKAFHITSLEEPISGGQPLIMVANKCNEILFSFTQFKILLKQTCLKAQTIFPYSPGLPLLSRQSQGHLKTLFCTVKNFHIFFWMDFCLLVDFLLTRNRQSFVHQSEKGPGGMRRFSCHIYLKQVLRQKRKQRKRQRQR